MEATTMQHQSQGAPVADWKGKDLPKLTTDLAQCKRDLDEWGYCLLADVVDDPECQRLLGRLEEQARLEREQGVAYLGNGGRGGQTWIGGPREDEPLPPWQGVRTLVNKGRPFIDLVMNKKLIEIAVHQFAGMPFYLCSTNGLIVRKGAIPMVVHSDQILVPFETPLPCINNAMICLSEFTKANGATRVVPGSHKWPAPKIAFDEKILDAYNPESVEMLSVEVPARTAIVIDGRLWHSSAHATGGGTRYSISLAYIQAFMRQQDCYAASLQDDVYESLSKEEREMIGFKTQPFGRIDPRVPGDRSNTDVVNPFVPELRSDSPKKAVPVRNETTFGGYRAAVKG